MAPSKFLETLSLRALISPVTKEDFRIRYWEQKPLVVHRANPNFYGDLFTLHDFDDAIARQPSYVKSANAEIKKNVSYKTSIAPGLEATLDSMREGGTDRKSTRLNSSHLVISYAVFCLKKKKNKTMSSYQVRN